MEQMNFGLDKSIIDALQAVLEGNSKVDKVVLFGSRAKGNYKNGSDIDLAVKGFELTAKDILNLHVALADLNLIYEIDLLNYDTINEPELKAHIDRVGIEFYSRWKEFKLGDLIHVINGYAFKSGDFLISSLPNSLPIVKIKNVANGDVNLEGVQYHIYSDSLKKYVIEKGDLLISLTGNHPELETQVVGLISKYKLGVNAFLNQRVAKLFSKSESYFSNNYLYYFLKDKDTHQYLASQSSGSANQANISKTDIENIPISLPPIEEQNIIASILSSLDDKIDLLHRQNKTLEQLAETLFRQWFVEEAEESWEEFRLYDCIELIGGGTPKTENFSFWNGPIPWLSGGDIASNHKGFVLETEKYISESGLQNSSTKLIPKFSTVISARGTVGKYCLLSEPMTFSQSNYGITPKFDGCFFFTYLLIAYSVDELQAAAYGSVFDTITTNTFKEHKIQLPVKSEIIKFEESIKSYFEKMLVNETQIQTLTKTRDSLLPKLMNGEVRF
jgi:type I restriction enzyme S subunit